MVTLHLPRYYCYSGNYVSFPNLHGIVIFIVFTVTPHFFTVIAINITEFPFTVSLSNTVHAILREGRP